MVPLLGEIQPGMKFADLHLHTNLSDGKLASEQLVEMAEKSGYLSAIAITDHGTLESGIRASQYARQKGYKVQVIWGQEITTTQGDIISLFFSPIGNRGRIVEPIKDHLSPRETVKRIKGQGGLVYIPHPFLKMFGLSGFGEKGSQKLLEIGNIDAWEVFNAGMEYWKNPRLSQNNIRALEFYQEHSDQLGAPIAGSDGHGYMPGWAFIGYQGDLRQAILEKRTVPIRLDEVEEERLTRMAMIYHNQEEIGKVNRIRKRHKLPLYGARQPIEVVLAKAKNYVSSSEVSTFLSPEELIKFHKKLRPGKPNWEASNWAAARLAAKLAYQQYYPGESLPDLVIENQKREGSISSGPPWARKHPNLFASLTHWGQYGAAVVAPHPVGIDISGLRPVKIHEDPMKLMNLLNEISSDDEMELWKVQEDTKDLITRLWSVKEAGWKGPQKDGVRRNAAPLNLSGLIDSPNAFRIEIRDSFPHDYWMAHVLKLEPGIHMAVAYPQNHVPNAYTDMFKGNVEVSDVLKPVTNLPSKIPKAFEVSSLHV
jgi:phosphopantetheinyl transferase (holo-ACP synthase)